MDEVSEALHAKEKMKQIVSSEGSASNGEALSIRGRTENKSNNGIEAKVLMVTKADQNLEAREINSASIARSITTL